jgi:hypothetical protein
MKTIKKAKNGTTTAKTTIRPGVTTDSTSIFKNKAKDMARKSLYAEAKGDKKLSDIYMEVASKATSDAERQKLKGKPGYDKNGYPIKKKAKSGATIAKAKDGKWMQKAAASIKKRGTKGVCTGAKFGGPTCKPGSKRYNLAKTFKSVAKKKK